ncbi:hypothetical protein FRC00_005990 [Tulasnella sp. 408]|nr:hypothetical protein FRC00_005990 [Tulasnella sp. 408]
MLRELRTETKAILSRYSTQHVVTQLARSVGGTQNETSLWQFYEVVYGFLLIDQSLPANLLRHGKLHVPMANAWWKVGRVATVPIRPEDVSATFSWDPAALSSIEELLSPVESPEIQREVVGELINEADLVLLLGRVQATRGYQVNSTTDSWYSGGASESYAKAIAT